MDAPQYVHVYVPSGYLFIECFITNITGIRMLPSMYTLMYLQISSVNECFITNITAIWTLPSMYMLMNLQT